MKYDLSLVISGIRTENWEVLYEEMKNSCSNFSFEIVFCSYNDLPDPLKKYENVKYIKDFGCPSRCLQLGTTIAEGEMIAIVSDDGKILKNSFNEAIRLLKNSTNPYKNIVALRYTEGQNFIANPEDFAPKYWHAKYHGDLRLQGIEDNWKICLMFLMNTERYREMGGIDCRFEHFNMNLHDLAFRSQRDGSEILISENFVTAQNWEPNRGNESPIIQAFYENDRPLFNSTYSSKENSLKRPIKIDYDNWKEADERWRRRFR